jgi:hypothetical protein
MLKGFTIFSSRGHLKGPVKLIGTHLITDYLRMLMTKFGGHLSIRSVQKCFKVFSILAIAVPKRVQFIWAKLIKDYLGMPQTKFNDHPSFNLVIEDV